MTRGYQLENSQAPKNTYALPALIAGIVSFFLAAFFVPQIIAIFLGAKGITRADELANLSVQKTGKGMSIAGLTLGIVYIFIGIYQWT